LYNDGLDSMQLSVSRNMIGRFLSVERSQQ
jgi:hypothetical protein